MNQAQTPPNIPANQRNLLEELLPLWLKTEGEFASSAPASNAALMSADPDYELTMALLKDWDAKKAEALAIHSRPHPLQILRALIQRGHLSEASRLVEKLRNNMSSEGNHAMVELLLEEARISQHNGQFETGRKICNQAIDLDPPSVTLIAILQVRALCNFEMGDFQNSLSDIETLESLSKIFPNAPTLIYARVIRIKIMARMRGISPARKDLDRLWKNTTHNPDTVLTLLRTEIDLRRLEKREYFDLIIACYWLSEKMGDRLYAALAFLDFYCAKKKDSRNPDLAMFNGFVSDFPKIRQLLTEIEGPPSKMSTTAATIAGCIQEHQLTWPEMSFDLVLIPKIELILRATVDSLTVQSLPRRKQLFEAASHLKTGRISKADFFALQWGKSRYVPILHDGVVRTLICRMRKELKLPIDTKDGFITMGEISIVDI